jgi:hypothetical protein
MVRGNWIVAAFLTAAATVCLCLVSVARAQNFGGAMRMAQQAPGAPRPPEPPKAQGPARPQATPVAVATPKASPSPAGTLPAGASPYAKGGNPLSDPNFVPILVNVQSAHNAKIYAEAGVNVYDSVDDIVAEPNEPQQLKATAETLKMLSDLGIYLIAEQDVWKGQIGNPTIIGWVSPVDEPDNILDGGKAMPMDQYMTQSRKIKATDPTRPYFVCFGQGVANLAWKGRGAPYEDYPKYMGIVDFVQYDVYPITNIGKDDGENYLEMVGQGVTRIRQWTGNKKPVLCWIETNHIKSPKHAPTPAQTACEVWVTMVHGARGVGYFCHDFTLETKKASALSRDEPMLAQLKITNAKLKSLARIVSAPLASEPAVAKGEGGKVIFSTKKVEGATAVLSVNVLGEKAKATIALPLLKKGQSVEVLEEGRSIQADQGGSFTDEFAPYQEHVYRVSAAK